MLAAAALVLLSVLAVVAPLREWVLALHAFFGAGGLALVVLYILLFALWNLLLPPMPLQLLAGFIWGIGGGMLVIYAGSSLAIIASMLVARSLARERIRAALARRRVWRALDAAVAREGWRAVLLLRLSNVLPSNLANLACGCTDLRITTVLWASWLGKFPGVLLSVLLGVAGEEAIRGDAGVGPVAWVMLAIGILASAAMGVLLARRTRQMLAIQETQDNPAPVV